MNANQYVEQIQPKRVIADVTPSFVAIKLDDVSTPNVTYVGKASVGSSGASAVWQIMKLDESGTPVTLVATWADSNPNFDNVWDDRTSLSYS